MTFNDSVFQLPSIPILELKIITKELCTWCLFELEKNLRPGHDL